MKCVAIAAVLCWTSAAWANPVDAFGLGARASSMAGAQVAATDDTSANYYNPAALATFERIRFDFGYQAAIPNLRINGEDLRVDSSRGFTLGIAVPGRIGPVKVAVGGGLFIPDQHVARLRTLANDQPRFALYDNRPQRFFLGANVAASIKDRLWLGAGISYMSSTNGSATLDGRVGFPMAEDSDLQIAIDTDLINIRYGQFGALLEANDWLMIGASYREEFSLDLVQIVIVEGDIGPEGNPVVEDAFLDVASASQDLFQPAQVTLGLDAQLSDRLGIAFDLTYQRWSSFENPAAIIDLELDAGMFNDLIDLPENPPAFAEPNFSDTIVPRLGVEWLVTHDEGRTVHLRSGYSYERSPAPEQVGETNFVDNDKHTFMVGMGYTLRDFTEILPHPVSIDAFVGFTLLPARDHRKLSPVDPIGDYQSEGAIPQLGLQSRWRF